MTATNLWTAEDEEGNECALTRDDDTNGEIRWHMTGGMYFSGYPSIKLNKDQMEELAMALMIELVGDEMFHLTMEGDPIYKKITEDPDGAQDRGPSDILEWVRRESDKTIRPPRVGVKPAGEREDTLGRSGVGEILGGGDVLRKEGDSS